ncbi:MAG: C69 family dipeptidase, partial [Bacteroidales bacterium]|nr:C69 family dipeptidase [Bacteroidales bacterium]
MIRKFFTAISICVLSASVATAQIDYSDWVGNYPDGCTSITVGKKASADGSVFTSHTDDSHRSKS